VKELEAERMAHIDYSVDLQRIIEDVCHSRDVRSPKTTARYHYDLATNYRTRLLAERNEAFERAAAIADGFADRSIHHYHAVKIAAGIRQLKEQQG